MTPLLLALLTVAPIPRPLVTLESAAEDLGEAAQDGHWQRATQLLARAQSAERRLEGHAEAAPLAALSRSLADAKAALDRHDRWAAAFAANRASAAVVALYAPLHPNPPVDVMTLDVVLRTVQLDALTGAVPGAADPLGKAEAAWSRLEAAAPLQHAAITPAFERQLAEVRAAQRANDGRRLAAAAGRALEGVDRLEDAFLKAH
jgi:hypothetical protein